MERAEVVNQVEVVQPPATAADNGAKAAPTARVTCHDLLSLLDHAIISIGCLSYIVDDILGLSKEILGADEYGLYNVFESINEYFISHQKSAPSGEISAPSCQNVFDFFSKSFLDVLIKLGRKTSADILTFQHSFQKFRELAFMRLCTSLEEKGTIDAYHNKTLQHEEKAIKDLNVLHQQLQFEREERSRAFSQFQVVEHCLHQEEELVQQEALEAEQRLESEFNALEEQESKIFLEKESNLIRECTQIKIDLKHLQVHHNNIKEKLHVYQSYFKEKELETRERKKENAVVFIQYAWRRHQRRNNARGMQQKKEEKTQYKKGKKAITTSPKKKSKSKLKKSAKSKK